MPSFAPEELPASELYDLLAAAVVPRPIALVSTVSSEGVANLAPFSFFMLGGSRPPSLAFSPTAGPDGREKNTLVNIEATGEFVVNLVDRAMAEGMNAAAFAFPEEVDEWPFSGFEALDSDFIQPKRVAASPAQFECRLFQIVRHGEGWGAARYVIGEILRTHFGDSSVPSAPRPTPNAQGPSPLRLIGRLGGKEYVDLDSLEIFELTRPSEAPSSSGI